MTFCREKVIIDLISKRRTRPAPFILNGDGM